MSELIDIIISAVDNASSIFSSVTSSAEEMESEITSAAEEGASDFDEMGVAAENAGESVESISSAAGEINGGGLDDAASAADSLENEAYEADTAIQSLNDDLGIINSSMLLQLGEQVGQLGSQAESMAQDMNTAAISVGQLATQAGIAEPEMVALINNISNATFPNDEAMMYVKVLSQIGVEASNLGTSATGLDRINDAFGLGAEKTASLAQELSVLGVDMNNVSDSFNALAYANANTVGGMEAYYTFLRKFDAQFKELGLDVDQASVLIAAATHKFGGGRAALTGLSDALKESDGDLRALEQALDLAPGSLDNASQMTGQYAGQLDKLADEEAEHKSLLDQLGAAWEDLSLSLSPVLEPLASAIGLIGQIGSFGIQIGGLKTLGQTIISVATSLGILTAAEETNTVAEEANTVATEGNTIAKTLGSAIESIAAVATTAYAAIVGVLTGEIGLVTAATMIWNAVLAMNPIVWIIALIVALIVVIYEVGKAFGWWTDVSSMLEAIWAGLQRLWSAFINHPDVQAVIKAIGDAWNWVVSGIQWVINAIMEFFGVATGGEFDIVRAIIDGIGLAWQWLSLPIRYVVMVVQAAVSAFQWLWQVLEPVGQFLLSIMVPVWTMVADILGQVIGYVMSVIEVFGQLLDGTANLGDVFNTVWGGLVELMSGVAETIWNTIVTVITNIANGIVEFVTNMLVWSLQAGWNFVTGLVTWLSQLPGKVLTFLIQVATNIMVQTARWVMTAKQKAMELVTNVVNFIRQLPGRILSLLMQVLSNIINAGRQWVTNAKNKAKEVVDGAVNTIKQLPDKIAQAVAGVVDAIVKPFRDAYNQAKSWWDRITSLGTGGWGGDEAWGGDNSAWGGDDTAWGGDSSIYKGLIKTPHGAYIEPEALDVNYNHKLTLSFEDVPPHMSEETLVKLLSRKNVLKSITENPDFQNLDAEMKRKAIDRINRARGV